jgi:dienelactone hydrolase
LAHVNHWNRWGLNGLRQTVKDAPEWFAFAASHEHAEQSSVSRAKTVSVGMCSGGCGCWRTEENK